MSGSYQFYTWRSVANSFLCHLGYSALLILMSLLDTCFLQSFCLKSRNSWIVRPLGVYVVRFSEFGQSPVIFFALQLAISTSACIIFSIHGVIFCMVLIILPHFLIYACQFFPTQVQIIFWPAATQFFQNHTICERHIALGYTWSWLLLTSQRIAAYKAWYSIKVIFTFEVEIFQVSLV